jgi:hypothetical protein
MQMKCNAPSIPKSNFEHYYRNFIISNKDRINVLRLSNPFSFDIVFSPPRMISEFIRLETLILDNINTNSLYEIFQELMSLTNLHSLTLNIAEYVDSLIEVFSKVFLLSKLKFCKIKYRIKTDYNPLPNCLSISPIEHLIINARFPLNSLYNLIDCIPKLRRLSVNYLIHSSANEHESCPLHLAENLKHISLKLDLINLNTFEKIIKNFFGNLEVLTISTKYDEAYLDANR